MTRIDPDPDSDFDFDFDPDPDFDFDFDMKRGCVIPVVKLNNAFYTVFLNFFRAFRGSSLLCFSAFRVSVLLWLLPLLSINAGYYSIRLIDNYWQQIEQQNTAVLELEALEASGCFEKTIIRQHNRFFTDYKAVIRQGIDAQALPVALKSITERYFSPPFAQSDLYLFRFDGDSTNLLQ